MFEDLVRTIGSLRSRIKEHGHHIGGYETRTRIALIDPLLTALGWNVSDPNQVEVETRTRDGWADYALLGGNGKPLVFVEAKKLSDKTVPVAQTVGYVVQENTSSNADVRYCVCTNGETWTVLDIRSTNPVAAEISLTRDGPPRCAVKLLGLWRSSLLDGTFEAPLAPLVDTRSTPSGHQPPQGAKAGARLSGIDSGDRDPQPAADWTALRPSLKSRGKRAPTSIRFPDGEVKQTQSWKQLWVETSQWLLCQGQLTPDAAERPFGKQGKTYLFSPNRQNPSTGAEFREPVHLESGDHSMFLETHMSAEVIVRRTAELLERCGYQPSQISLNWPRTA